MHHAEASAHAQKQIAKSKIAAFLRRKVINRGASFAGRDAEVESLIIEAANRARSVIKANLDKLEALKDRLLEKETVDADEVAEVLSGAKLPAAAAQY